VQRDQDIGRTAQVAQADGIASRRVLDHGLEQLQQLEQPGVLRIAHDLADRGVRLRRPDALAVGDHDRTAGQGLHPGDAEQRLGHRDGVIADRRPRPRHLVIDGQNRGRVDALRRDLARAQHRGDQLGILVGVMDHLDQRPVNRSAAPEGPVPPGQRLPIARIDGHV